MKNVLFVLVGSESVRRGAFRTCLFVRVYYNFGLSHYTGGGTMS